MKLENKKVIVIGASSGIGAAIARQLAAKNCDIALIARREEKLNELAESLNKSGVEPLVCVYPCDVTQYDKAESLLSEIARRLGGLDALFYCSGVMHKTKPGEYDFARDKEMIDVNLLGAMAWINAAAPRFATAGAGAIVGISSIAGDRGRASMPGYMTSKAAFSTYLESIRNRVAKRGVLVTTVKPGYVDTEMLAGVSTPLKPTPAAEVAKEIIQAVENGSETVYTPGFWRFVGLVLKHAPSFVMQRVNF